MPALTWFCALACLAVVAYLVRRGDIGSAVLAMLAVQSIAALTAPRADLFSTVFFALFLGELWAYHCSMRSRPWLLPVIMLLWVNLHPGFIAGVGVIGAFLLLEISDLLFAERRQAALLRLRPRPWLAACGMATLVNPWGPKIYVASLNLSGLAAPAQGMLNSNTFIGEFQGVPLSSHLLYQLIDIRHMENGFTWLLLLALVVVGLFLWKQQVGAALIALLALYFGLAHARYMGMFAITVATLGGTLLSELFVGSTSIISTVETEKTTASRIRVPIPIAIIVTAIFCAVSLLHIVDFVSSRTYVVFNADWRFGAGVSSWFPAHAAAFIQREQLPGIFSRSMRWAAMRPGPSAPSILTSSMDAEIASAPISWWNNASSTARAPITVVEDRIRSLESECSTDRYIRIPRATEDGSVCVLSECNVASGLHG